MIGVGVIVGVLVGAGVYGAGVAVGRIVAAWVSRTVGDGVTVGVARVMTCPQPARKPRAERRMRT